MAHALYEADFYLWTQDQAEALRAREGGLNRLDYDNLAEEVGDLGSSELNRCRSWVFRIIEHLHKLETSQATDPRRHWSDEILNWRADLEFTLTKSMRRLVDDELEQLHTKAARHAQKSFDMHEAGRKVDASRRWTLAELLGEADDPLPALASPRTDD